MRPRIAAAILLALVLVIAGFTRIGVPSGFPSAITSQSQPTATVTGSAPASAPTSASAASPSKSAPASSQTVSTTTDASAAIKALIEKANQEQQDAFAKGDPTIMQDTATSSYYSEIAQINSQMTAGGVASIKLLGIEWGPITMTGSTSATATTYETWRTVYTDGTTEDSRDRNVYSLALQNGSWLIQADNHPDAQTGSGGQSTTPGQTTVPGAPTSPSQPTTPSSTTLPISLDSSHNWSGYAATGGTYTSVTGTWTVPSPSANGGVGVGATWVGIGGTSSRDLIQAGTQEMTDGQGRVRYSAWTEVLPATSENVPLAISPGDSVTVSIAEQSKGQWQIVIKNNTTGQDYKTTVKYSSSYSSAEWIVEAPSSSRSLLPLDNFGSIQFTDATATKDGKTVTIAQAKGSPISMVDRTGSILASPSGLTSDGKGFTVTRTDVPASTMPVGRPGRGRSGG